MTGFGISQIKIGAGEKLLHKLMLTASGKCKQYRLEGDPGKERKRDGNREKRKMLQTNIPNKRRLMLNKIINKIEKQNRSELNGIVRKRPKMRMFRMLRRYIRNILLIEKKKIMRQRQPELKQGQKDRIKLRS